MTTAAQDIVDAIDAAILAGASGPGEFRTESGRVIKYRSLDELRATRNYYARLQSVSAGSGGSVRVCKLQPGSARL